MTAGAASGLGDYRALADAMPQLVWTARADGPCEYVNVRWTEYTGLASERLLDSQWHEVVHPDDRAPVAERWARCVATGEPYEIEMRILGADGVYRSFLTRGVPVRDAAGAIVQWFGTSTDIEDRKRGEASLRFLATSGELLASSLDRDHTLRSLAQLAMEALADWAIVFLYDDRTRLLRPFAAAHRDPLLVAKAEAFLARYPDVGNDTLAAVAASGASLLEAHFAADAPIDSAVYAREDIAFVRSLGIHSALAVPIVARGRTIGLLRAISSDTKRSLNDADVRLAELLAKRAATAIDNAMLYDEQRRTARRMRFIAAASEALATSLDLDETLSTLKRLPVPEFADWTMLNLVDENGVVETGTAYHRDPRLQGAADEYARHSRPDPSARHGRGRVIATGRSEVKEHIDAEHSARVIAETGAVPAIGSTMLALGYTASITVPILIDGRVRGVLAALRSDPDARYSEDDLPIFEDLARRAASAIANAESYMRESRASQIFQRAFLPTSLPNVPGVAFNAIYAPGEAEAQIGGDWYDAFPLPDGRIVVSIGDVTGRGLQAAVIMAKMRQSLETLTYFERDPARLLEAADVTLRRIDGDAIVTALVGVLDPARGTFSYATAGHPPPILATPDGDMVKLPGRGLPLGLRGDFETPTTTVRLPDGALIVLFTDGLIEATHDILEGERRLDAALLDPQIVGADDPARAIQRRVLFDGSPDDVAILTFRYAAPRAVVVSSTPTPQSELSMHWSFDAREARASHDVRGVYVQYLSELAEAGADVGGAELVFGELVSNVVRHAPGPIEIELEWTASRPVLHVLDRGSGFPRTNALPTDIMSESGRGLYLVDLLTEEFTVTTLPGYGTHARAVLPIRRAHAGRGA
jgi:PAS domain S-box-containing protein